MDQRKERKISVFKGGFAKGGGRRRQGDSASGGRLDG